MRHRRGNAASFGRGIALNLAPVTLLAALIAGVIGSGHCVAMCGGIAGALGLSSRAAADRVGRGFVYPLAYNLGRITSYSLAGAIAGGIGAGVGLLRHADQVRFALQMFAGAWIVAMGLALALRGRGFTWLESAGLAVWRKLSPLLRPLLPINRPHKAFAAGMIWGWLPCGMAYTMLLAAWMSTDALTGAALMFAFGLGTLPALLIAGGAAQAFAGRVTSASARRVGGFAIAALGALTLVAPWLLPAHAHGPLAGLIGCLPSLPQ